VRIWDVDSPDHKPRRHYRSHGSLALGASFSADGERLATIGYDRLCALWETVSGRPVLVFRDLTSDGLCVRFSPDGSRLAGSCSDGTIRVWDAAPLAGTGDQSLLTLRYPSELWAMDISSTTNWLACAGDNFLGDPAKGVPVQIWETGRDRLKRTLTGHAVVVFCLAFDPTGRFLASSGDNPSRLGNATVKIWDLATGAEAFPVEQFEGIAIVFAVAYNKDGSRLVGAAADGRLKVWDARSGRKLGIIGEHKREISFVAFSPDGKLLVSAGTDNTVKLWDATRLDERQENPITFEADRTDVSSSVAFSPDNARLVFARDDHAARIWDIATRKVVVVLESRAHRFLALAFSPDGRWVASGGADCTVKLWDAQTGRLLHTFRGHTGAMRRLAFVQLPEGLRLVSASRDGTVKYWDVAAVEQFARD
jgi:WD40 repeat protein